MYLVSAENCVTIFKWNSKISILRTWVFDQMKMINPILSWFHIHSCEMSVMKTNVIAGQRVSA